MSSVSKEDIQKARSVDLVDVATSLGYTVRKVGNYHTLKEMDSVRIYNRSSWYRWSDGTGGSQIDFILTFTGMSFHDAVKYLIEQSYEVLPPRNEVKNERSEVIFPTPASDKMRVKKYLTEMRGISEKTVDEFIKKNLIYQSKSYANIVFICRDKYGEGRAAMLRGTGTIFGGNYKGDCKGSDKSVGFRVVSEGSDTVRVFEAPIDLMSFYDSTGLKSDHLIALGSTWDKPLMNFLDDYPEVNKVILCLDNDEAGINASLKIKETLSAKGYEVKNLGSPSGFKDYNEWLVAKKQMARVSVAGSEPEPVR